MSIDLMKLSKMISYALRHHPEEFDLSLDEEGWCSLDDLLMALRKKPAFQTVGEEDIHRILQKSEKQRFELCDGRIRALYGHSCQTTIHHEPKEPPEFLYHGTAHRFLASIRKQGLIPKGRQYVHLSNDRETATTVGKRRDDDPVLLTIAAHQAYEDGITFYYANDNTWLCEELPSQYIK